MAAVYGSDDNGYQLNLAQPSALPLAQARYNRPKSFEGARERSWHRGADDVPLRFHGAQRRVFPDLVVSLFLSVVTLGIYSAWGKVRKKRYLYSHTELDGTGFEFRAAPLAILRGRVIALVLLGGFALSGHVLPIMQLVFIIILLVLTPWIVVAASRFNARNSAWRNITFGFDGGIQEAAKVFL
ncbi:MAG: DUF898 domain-containing protein, partial [Betaproteobacteria bacterium]